MPHKTPEPIVNCPKCNKPSPVSEGSTLIACYRCSQRMADVEELKEKAVNDQYDWPQTIENMKKKYGLPDQREVAKVLGLAPWELSAVKKGRRPMPPESMKTLKKEYWECVAVRDVLSHGPSDDAHGLQTKKR